MCAALGGCDPAGGDDAPDGRAGPIVAQAYDGSYAVTGTWDLSQPFGGDGIGGVLADLLIEEILGLASVPSTLEDEARGAIAGAIRQPIIDHVDALVPSELIAGSPTMMALDRIFSAVEIAGDLALVAGADPDVLSGTDTVDAIAVRDGDVVVTVAMPELLDGGVSVAGGFAGAATAADRITIGAHPLELRFGRLIALVARDALGLDADALAAEATAALGCPALVDVITGGGSSYDIEVAGQGFSVAASSLVSACDALRAELATRALGMVRPDAGITLGGPARLVDGDADATTDQVASDPGYGGTITALGLPVEPQVTATFSASR